MSRRRQWAFRLLAPVLAPLLVFGMLEGALRLGGFGYPTSFFLKRNIDGRQMLVENPRFNWRFFGPTIARAPYPTVLPAAKSPGTVRIFVFGESAAFGDPDPDFGLARMLRTLLEDRYPGVPFEVVNAAMVAINSNVILPLARECAGRDGDIWVIYMGNNEVIGPYGAGTVFGSKSAGRGLIRSSLAVKSTRSGQLLGAALKHFGLGPGAPEEWKGMMMFAENKVAADDPRMAVVYSNFRDNLADILKAGRDQGAKVIVATVGSNLKDCAPFASIHRQGLFASQLGDWEKTFHAGIAAESAGDIATAADFYQKAAALDDQFADLQFRWARCTLAAGRDDEALKHFELARDYDALRFRCDSRLNDIIRKTAQGREKEGIYFFDAEQAFAAASPKNLPGRELFYEHVHLELAGNYLLARNLAETVAQSLSEKVKGGGGSPKPWLTQDECASRMVWSDWSQYRALQNLPIRFPPFTEQLDHDQQYHRVEERLKQLQPSLQPASLQRTVAAYREALARSPGDWVFHRNLAQLLQRLGDLPGSARSWQDVIRLIPQNGNAYLRLGLICMQQGKMAEALQHFETELELDHHVGNAPFVKLLDETAAEMLQQGRINDAIALYRQALELNSDTGIRINLGLALITAGRLDEARENFRKALEHGAEAPQSLIVLGEACLANGWTNEAISAFERTIRMDPANATVHCRLGDALHAANRFAEAREEYARAVRLKPDFAEAHSRLGAELARAGGIPEAINHFKEALRLDPRLAEAHDNWGIVLLRQQQEKEAREQFEEALRINPTDSVAQAQIRILNSGK